MIDFDHKIRDLDVSVASRAGGQLRRRSQFEFEYLAAAAGPVSLLMPVEDRTFLGFEDIAALMDLRVGGALTDRKYRGSYEAIARLVKTVCSNTPKALEVFFEQLALSVLVRNGDAHLKNFGVLYDDDSRWFAPLFDVVTTTIYPYERDGVLVTDRTMALRLVSQGSRGYPLPEQLVTFGREHCELIDPKEKIAAITSAMHETLAAAPKDSRVPRSTFRAMKLEWEESVQRFS